MNFLKSTFKPPLTVTGYFHPTLTIKETKDQAIIRFPKETIRMANNPLVEPH